jgi:hypothetical protein
LIVFCNLTALARYVPAADSVTSLGTSHFNMKKAFVSAFISFAFSALGVYGQNPAAKTPPPPGGAALSPQAALVKQYCAVCHNPKTLAGSLVLENLNPDAVSEHPEIWEKVVRKLRAGMMPPSGMRRPAPDVLEKFISTLEADLDKTTKANVPAPGLHRLNRTEYANVIRDLLGLEVDATKFLPPDDSTRGFDNVAAALQVSPALLEGYTSAASKIARLALGDVTAPIETTYRVPEDTSQDYQIEGLPFGTRGGMMVRHLFPADGTYSIKITPISKGNMGNTNPFGEIKGEKLELLLDGERLKLFDWDTERARADGTFNFKFPAKAGSHVVGVTFIATNMAPGNDLNKHFMRETIETGGLPGYAFFPHIGKIVMNGPYDPKGPGDTLTRQKLLVCRPANASQETPCAKQILSTFARRAFRRPVTTQDTEDLLNFYQQGRNTGTFDNGIEMALRRILADPDFVFRKESEPANVRPGQRYRISDIELASRLSFFLWSSIPDDELLNLATQGKLKDPVVLEAQVKRMLADERSEQLITNFAGQWLGLRALQTQVPATSLYPDFDDNLRQAMRKETELFVSSIVHEDRSITDLLDGNYTFVNERLAKHYGIPNIYGSNFRRVTLGPDLDVRRGLLGKGYFLTISSVADRNAPVIRGKTVMQVFLGVEPPPPPPDVKIDLKAESTRGAAPSMRQQMEQHRKVEPCASCHKIMDPIGLSLENFDAIGQWRTMDAGHPIDASGMLVDGTKLNGVKELREAMVRYKPQFSRVLTEKLMTYALGRGTEYFDMPMMRSIVHNAEKNNYKFSTFVLGVVKSDPFQMNEKEQLSASR